MASSRVAVLRKAVRSVAAANQPAATDRELLRRFARDCDQAAFEAVVARHAAMVLGVCRRALPTVQDAEDGCQATFLVLANRAKDGRWQESVANWLYATARKVAHNARVAADRRAKRESRAAVPEAVEPVDRMTGRELLATLDAALDALPPHYREPLVLCYLEGLTRDEAAQRLGLPLATLHTRIDRARKRLHEVLTKAGCALGVGLLALAVSSPAGASPPRLVESVLAASSSPSAAVRELVRAVTVNGTLNKALLALAAVGMVALGIGLGTLATSAAGQQTEKKAQQPPASGVPVAPPPAEARPATKRIEVKGTVLGPDDKPVAGAKLFLHDWEKLTPSPQAAAGDDGRFAFTLGEEETGYVLVATAPGHGIAWGYLHHPRPLSALTLRLTRDEPITGKVVNLEGKPVAGVSVSVVAVHQPHEEKTLDRWLKAARYPKGDQHVSLHTLTDWPGAFAGLLVPVTSDRDGKFVIRGVGRDRVATLRVTGPTTATHEVNVVTRDVERFTAHGPFYNGGTSFHGSSPIVVAAPVPVTTGRVLDATTGKPVPGTMLWVEHLAQNNFILMGVKAVVDRDGRFTLPGLPRGNAGLSVLVFPPEGEPYHRLRLSIPDGTTERAAFDVKLARGIPATVKIIDKTTGKPVKAFLRYGVFPDDNPNAKAVPHVWHDSQWTDKPYYYPSRDEFRVVVFPGKGLVAAGARWNGEYLTGVGVDPFEKYRQDGQLYGLVSTANMYPDEWHTFAEIDVPADAKEFSVTLALDRGLSVTGRLIDGGGKPVEGAENFGLTRSIVTGPAWSPPATTAEFTALALRPGEKRRVMFVHRERKLAGTAVVVGGAKEPTEVRLEPWGEVTGRIVDVNGKPVAGRVDMSYDVVRNPDLKLGSSPLCYPGAAGPEAGPDGRFRITGLVPGLTYRWYASGWKVGEAIIPDFVPKAGETTDLGDIVVREKEQ